MIIKSKVSIIVPVYNSELYLTKCLNSVISQTFSNLEIILVNDGSTDSSPKIINEDVIKDDRIVAIHKENGGIGSAYKAAFEVMFGDYILFVDSDNWLELDAIENGYEALKNICKTLSLVLKGQYCRTDVPRV